MSPPLELNYGDWNSDTAASSNVAIEGDTFTLATTQPASGVARWEFEQTPSDSWGDNDLTLNGGPAYTTTNKVGSYALSFDGMDDEALNTSFPDIGNEFTAMSWVRPTATLDDFSILLLNGNQGGAREYKFILQADSSGNLRANIANGSSSAMAGAYSYTVDEWLHLALTYDGSTLRFFTNGSQSDSNSVSMTTYTTSEFYHGFGVQDTGARTNYASVILDDPRVYDVALSESEINNVYQNTV